MVFFSCSVNINICSFWSTFNPAAFLVQTPGESRVWRQQENLKRSLLMSNMEEHRYRRVKKKSDSYLSAKRSLPLDKQQANRSRGPWGVGGSTSTHKNLGCLLHLRQTVPSISNICEHVWRVNGCEENTCYLADLDWSGPETVKDPQLTDVAAPPPDTYTFISLLSLDFWRVPRLFFLRIPRADPSLFPRNI